jgi:hypothetical protein
MLKLSFKKEFLSGRDALHVFFYRLFISVLPLDIQLTRGR